MLFYVLREWSIIDALIYLFFFMIIRTDEVSAYVNTRLHYNLYSIVDTA